MCGALAMRWPCASNSAHEKSRRSLILTEYAAHRFLGVVLHVRHVGAHDIQAEMRDHLFELHDPPRARGNLRPKVGQILIDIARGISARREDSAHLVVEKAAFGNQLNVVEQDALLVDVGRVRRHRARGRAADVGVMSS